MNHLKGESIVGEATSPLDGLKCDMKRWQLANELVETKMLKAYRTCSPPKLAFDNGTSPNFLIGDEIHLHLHAWFFRPVIL